jgi:hypothetical protein
VQIPFVSSSSSSTSAGSGGVSGGMSPPKTFREAASPRGSSSSASAVSAEWKIGCDICGQTISLSDFVNNLCYSQEEEGTTNSSTGSNGSPLFFPSKKRLNLFNQHRYYCPYVNKQYLDGETEMSFTSSVVVASPSSSVKQDRDDNKENDRKVIGWNLCWNAVNEGIRKKFGNFFFLSEREERTVPVPDITTDTDLSLLGRKRRYSETKDTGSSEEEEESRFREKQSGVVAAFDERSSASCSSKRATAVERVEVSHLSPENIYKKIRTVLFDAIN